MTSPRKYTPEWFEEHDRREREREEQEVPYAEVKPGGSRFSWYIYVHHGVWTWGPNGGPTCHFGTQAGAEAKAARLLAKYARIKRLEQRPVSRITST